eukprot:TRINITY_DN70949_c0_g1_i1.p1 TRINITY_DN70949_c0_g1~~TRINITY_DN70949_c0_g1_i1.p1  ORF type:complete len:152 (+),score=36.76 TRINITY_DN70949_c0_g1_i1:91-546(+)
MAYYVGTIPREVYPLVDTTPYHTPYVRDLDSLELYARHDRWAAEDRARQCELTRFAELQACRARHQAELDAGNARLDAQLALQRQRVEHAAAEAYSPPQVYLSDACYGPDYPLPLTPPSCLSPGLGESAAVLPGALGCAPPYMSPMTPRLP